MSDDARQSADAIHAESRAMPRDSRTRMKAYLFWVVALALVLLVWTITRTKASLAKLQELANQGDSTGFEAEIRKGFDPKVLNRGDRKWQGTPLHAAAASGSPAIVESLLNRGVNPLLHLQGGETAMHFAILKGSGEIVREMLKHGVDPDADLGGGETPLTLASANGRVEMCQLLVSKGADVNKSTMRMGVSPYSPVAAAAAQGETQVLEFLLKSGAKVNVGGIYPFGLAIGSREPEKTISVLLKYGAEASALNVGFAREKLGRNTATVLLMSIRNPVSRQLARDHFCKDCILP